MREVVKDLESKEEAWVRDVGVPVEDALVDDFDLVRVSALGCFLALDGGEGGADLDYAVLCACVDVGVGVVDVVEDVGHHGAVSGAHLVDDQVAVGEEGEFVVLDEVSGDGFAVVGLEELGGGVPELADVGGGGGIETVFEGGVVAAEEGLEGGFVLEGGEGEGRVGREDHCVFREISIVGIVETVCI